MPVTVFPVATATTSVASFYQFVAVASPQALRTTLLEQARACNVLGTLLLGPEGINANIAGTRAAVAAMLDCIRAQPEFTALDVRWSETASPPFRRLKIKIKPEIVTLGQPDLATAQQTGTRVEPAAWNALIETADMLLSISATVMKPASAHLSVRMISVSPAFATFRTRLISCWLPLARAGWRCSVPAAFAARRPALIYARTAVRKSINSPAAYCAIWPRLPHTVRAGPANVSCSTRGWQSTPVSRWERIRSVTAVVAR